jgi:hypothetical protein
MHRSRLTSIVIDCSEDDYDHGRDFWSKAFGRSIVPRDDRFSSIKGRVGNQCGLYIGFQRVASKECGIHLDIEADDVEAEVSRLLELGASVKKRIRQHVVMQSPTGHAFCVVPAKRGDFPEGATEWT